MRFEYFRAGLDHEVRSNSSTTDVKAYKLEHVHMFRRERLQYKKKKDRAILCLVDYSIVIVDGAD